MKLRNPIPEEVAPEVMVVTSDDSETGNPEAEPVKA